MKMNCIFDVKNVPQSVKENDIYLYGQIRSTYYGILILCAVWSFYFFAYLYIDNHVFIIISVCNIALSCIGYAFFLKDPMKRRVLTANFILVLLFLTLYPIALFTGGLNSSTALWFVLFPSFVVFMNGIKNAAVWIILSLLALVSMFLWKGMKENFLFINLSTETDKFFDSIMMIFVVFVVISLNDASKRRTLKKLEKAQEKLKVLAVTDPLTGLLNRRAFMERAEKERCRSVRYQKRLSILMIDIDHFKKVNDNYGHAAGDQVLVAVSSVFKHSLRDIDLIGRYGGEEFIILLPESDTSSLLTVAERIRKSVEDTRINVDSMSIHLTVSIGAADFVPSESSSLDILISQADKALYQAKTGGRNKVSSL